MTIDMTIGKLVTKSLDEVLKSKFKEEYTYTYNDKLDLIDFCDVIQCSDESDGCSEKDTICPNSAYRTGSISGMCDFFNCVLPKLIRTIKPIDSNDTQITKIKPYIKEINNLEYSGDNEQHKMRLHWLKFWCNRAVELYDDDAAILFC